MLRWANTLLRYTCKPRKLHNQRYFSSIPPPHNSGQTDIDTQIRHYLQLIKKDQKDIASHFELGRLFISTNQYPLAFKSFEKVTELDPNSAQAFANLGFIYLRNNEIEKATVCLQKSIKLKVNSVRPYLYLSRICFSENKIEEGLSYL